jgi:hypothetical protein
MQIKYNTLLVILSLLFGLISASVWNNTLLDNWDNGWDHNTFGDPIDCDLEPCVKYDLIKPYTQVTADNYCSPPDSDGGFFCNYLPENAILVDNIDDLYA